MEKRKGLVMKVSWGKRSLLIACLGVTMGSCGGDGGEGGEGDVKEKVLTTTTSTTTTSTTTTTTLPPTTLPPPTTQRPSRSSNAHHSHHQSQPHDLSAIRACESTNNYQAVSSSGKYRGAYQFDQQTWDRFADNEYKGTDPAAAPPHVQDKTASRVTYDAWPNC